MGDEDAEARADEFLALSSIFEDEWMPHCFNEGGSEVFVLSVSLRLEKPVKIMSDGVQIAEISNSLPSIKLQFFVPIKLSQRKRSSDSCFLRLV